MFALPHFSRTRPPRPSRQDNRLPLQAAVVRTVEALEGRCLLSGTSFAPAVHTPLAHGATQLISADFNDDGTQDLVAAGPDGVSLLLGGVGQLGAARKIADGALAVAVGDFTGDYEPDVLLLQAGGSISVLPGKGDGTFGGAITTRGPAGAAAIATGDFDDDGNLDLAIAGSGGVTALFGRGDGKFHNSVLVSSAPASAVVAADINGDYTDDITFGGTGGVSVAISNDDGTFAAPIAVAGGAAAADGSIHLAVADFNYDGFGDIAASNAATGKIDVSLGQGDQDTWEWTGGFAAPVSVDAGGAVSALGVGDLTGDWNDDLLVTDSAAGAVRVLASNGDGTFADAIDTQTFAVGPAPAAAVVGDFTGDYFADLAAIDSQGVALVAQQAANVGVTVSAPASTAINGNLTYTITVTNSGSVDAANVSITDWLPQNVTYLSAHSSQGTVTFDDGSNSGGGVVPDPIPIDGGVSPGGTVSGGTVTGGVANGGVSAGVPVSAGGVPVAAPSSSSTIAADGSANGDPGSTTGGSGTGGGTGAGTGVIVDPLPPVAWPGSVAASLGDLAAGASATVTIVVKPTQYGGLSNSVSVSSDTADADYSNDYAYATTQIVGTSGAEVEVTQSTNGSGGPIYYANGPVPGATGGTTAGGTAAGVTTTAGVPTPVASSANGAVSSAPTNGANTNLMLPPIYWGNAQVGQPLVYTLTVTNHGPETATGLTLTDTLPADVTYGSATTSQGTVDASKAGTVSVALGDLAAGASATISVTVTPTKAGTIENDVTASAADPSSDPYPDNNSSTLQTYVYDPNAVPPAPIPLGAEGDAGGVAAPGPTAAGGSANTPTSGATATPPAISVSDASGEEGATGRSSLVFTVTRTGDTSAASTVNFATAKGTAKAGKDYLSRRGEVTFRPGVSEMKINVPIEGDTKVEKDETLKLDLSNASNGTLSASTATGTILNDDTKSSHHKLKVKIDFAPASATVAKHYLLDSGQLFGDRGNGQTYGWDADASAVDRGATKDSRSDTFVQFGGGAASNWQIALPNGKYTVKLVVGDPTQSSGTYQVDAEGAPFLAGSATVKHKLVSHKQTIEVTDGMLTLTAGAGTSNPLAYVEIQQR